MSSARGKNTRSVTQRLHRVRLDGDWLVLIRWPAVRLWLEHGALGVFRAACTGGRGACAGHEKEVAGACPARRCFVANKSMCCCVNENGRASCRERVCQYV